MPRRFIKVCQTGTRSGDRFNDKVPAINNTRKKVLLDIMPAKPCMFLKRK